ncbi:aminotransferase-like domain-containing protein, partial [Actinocorallia lasiicapitis]
WRPEPGRVLFAGNARQALAAALTVLAPPGSRLGVEELTYPVVKAIAHRLGITLVPLEVDGDGLVPDSLDAAHRKAPLNGVYLQPALHNPLSVTMPGARRAELAGLLDRLGLYAIEDAVWSFLADGPPLAALAPGRTVLVDSLSKRLAPGLTVGFAIVPEPLTAATATALRSGAWTPSGFALEAAARWLEEDTVRTVSLAKRDDAAARQRLPAERVAGFAVRTAPHSYYCWWELPSPWRADTFVAAAARHGIAVTPAAAFAVGDRRTPGAVRLALASPPLPTLDQALRTLAELAATTPDDVLAD